MEVETSGTRAKSTESFLYRILQNPEDQKVAIVARITDAAIALDNQ